MICKSARKATASRSRTVGLSFEALEDRVVPTTFRVVPVIGANGVTSFASLAQALFNAKANDTIQIEPGSHPGSATVLQNNLTIQGDPAVGAAGLESSQTEIGTITVGGGFGMPANNNTFRDLFVDTVSITTGITGTTVANSIVNGGSIVQAAGFGTNGNNTITGNTFLNGATVLLGNTRGSTTNVASNDKITNNLFANNAGNRAIEADNEGAGLLISGNRIVTTDPTAGIDGIRVFDGVGTISNNTLHLAGNPGTPAIGISIEGNGNTDTRATDITVTSNVVTTNSLGDGIFVLRGSSLNSFMVSVANNALSGNRIGLVVQGNGAGGASDFGQVSAGGTNALLSSPGRNDFRGFTGTQANFAIAAFDGVGGNNTSTVTAQGNIFSVNDPTAVVSTQFAPGTTIDVSSPQTGGPANLTAMFNSLGGGPPTTAQHSTVDGASPWQQSQAAVQSLQAVTVFVDGLYGLLLGRAAGGGEDQSWINAVDNGMTEEQLLIGFVTSTEYYAKVTQGSVNPNFTCVQSLYLNLLGRQGSTAEINGWLSVLAAKGLAAVGQGFVNSVEFRGIQVQAMYGATTANVIPTPDLLKRTALASPTEVAGWVNSGLDLLTIEAMVLVSTEFGTNG
jgi:hypothetical protein